MIEKMKFLSITGPRADIDRVVNEYLSKYEIHLENAMTQLSQVQNLSPYLQINPYKDLLNKVNDFASLIQNKENIPIGEISLEETKELTDSLSRQLSEIQKKLQELTDTRNSLTEDLNKITSRTC